MEGDTESDGSARAADSRGRPAQGFFLILFEKKIEPLSKAERAVERETISRQVDDELQSLKEQLNATVEQFEVSTKS